MTLGSGASAYDRGWVGQLNRTLADAGWRHGVVNLAVTGARVQDVLDRQCPALDELARAGRSPALVTVLVGSNDLVLRRHRAGLASRRAALIDRLPREAVVANLPNPRREARQVDVLLRDRAARGDVVVADMRRFGPRSWRGRLASDLFHPNDAGYVELARVFEATMVTHGFLDGPGTSG